MQPVEILVAGGGATGLAAALAFARRGLRVTVLGVPTTIADDGRSAALLAPSMDFLDSLGVGEGLRAAGNALAGIRILDATGKLFTAPPLLFRSSDLNLPAFGWNIPNAEILRVLIAACTAAGVTLRADTLADLVPAPDAMHVTTATGATLAAKLLIGADGRNSTTRQRAGIGLRQWDYRQDAFTCRFGHSRDHDDISTEFHMARGPFTMVPTAAGVSSLVWVCDPAMARDLAAMDEGALARAIERHSHALLGRISAIGPRGRVALSSLIARRFAAPRLALVGEAAHAMPPIGAQGLNIGFRDVKVLAETVCVGQAADPGALPTLQSYESQRRADVLFRVGTIDVMNRALIGHSPLLDAARALGLGALGALPPLRRVAMRLGLGLSPFTGTAPAAHRA